MERAEDLLDTAMMTRRQKAAEQEAEGNSWSDEQTDEYLDQMLISEGEIRGMLRQVALWRSTTMKTELDRAKLRVAYKAGRNSDG
jgi:hypothetical protein